MRNFRATEDSADTLAIMGVNRATAIRVLKLHLFDCLKEMKDAPETSILFREEPT